MPTAMIANAASTTNGRMTKYVGVLRTPNGAVKTTATLGEPNGVDDRQPDEDAASYLRCELAGRSPRLAHESPNLDVRQDRLPSATAMAAATKVPITTLRRRF